jgi:hypothetical protein
MRARGIPPLECRSICDKLRRMKLLRVLVVCATALAARGSFAQTAVTQPVPVYDSTQIALGSYTVIKRLWVQGWKSAFWIGGHRDEAAARRALLNEAGRLGADGVVNLHCLGQTDAFFNPSGYYCYGNAIKLKARTDRQVMN